ncbi:alpha/beta fold hydrolase [Cohnella hongkongensis]|uniref:Alpha/beta fold hydrolase n=1 Tax=Cohnella hongkongensis TaxID=178337 RepID=A0ABV9F766_9BACL
MPETSINGYRMHYIDRGKGPAIVFIHPPVLTSMNFQMQMESLSEEFRTIAFDIRGHGQSEHSQEEVTYPLIVEDIRQLLNRLGIDKAFLCGYSTGGSVVLEFLLTCPDRAFGGIVIGGMSEASDIKLRAKIALGRFLTRIGAYRPVALGLSWAQANAKASITRRLYRDAQKGSAKNAEQYYLYSLKYNCTARLGNIRQPVLLIYGKKDKSFHPYAHLLHQGLPTSELVWLRDAHHQIPTKAAEQLNEQIRLFAARCGERSPIGSSPARK